MVVIYFTKDIVYSLVQYILPVTLQIFTLLSLVVGWAEAVGQEWEARWEESCGGHVSLLGVAKNLYRTWSVLPNTTYKEYHWLSMECITASDNNYATILLMYVVQKKSVTPSWRKYTQKISAVSASGSLLFECHQLQSCIIYNQVLVTPIHNKSYPPHSPVVLW